MSIEVVKDPISGKNITLVKGIVNGIYFNDLKEIKDRGKNGKPWTPTHIIKVKIDNDYVGLGLTDKDRVGCQDADEKWHDLAKGMVVTAVVDVQKNGEYTNYNGRASALTINDASGAEAPSTPQAKGSPPVAKTAFDPSGMNTGAAINCAMALCRNKFKDFAELIELAKKIHLISESVKETHGKRLGLSPNSVAVGGSAGNALIKCCEMLTVAKIDLLEEKTLAFLEGISIPLLDFIKNGEPKKGEAKTEPQTDEDGEDDDIPF